MSEHIAGRDEIKCVRSCCGLPWAARDLRAGTSSDTQIGELRTAGPRSS